MIKYYSHIKRDLLLHQVFRIEEMNGRNDLCSEDSYIQCAALSLDEGTKFKPHKHNIRKRVDEEYITQESWVVIKGEIRCTFYDIDDSVLASIILRKGDVSFTFYGGHTFEVTKNGTLLYEYKTGKYEGVEIDKKFI